MLGAVRKPMILSNMRDIDREYRLLVGRRRRLQEELSTMPFAPVGLIALRHAEITYIDAYIARIDKFLRRYGYERGEQ